MDGEILRIAEMMDVCENKELSINLIRKLRNIYNLKEETVEKLNLIK